MRIDLRTAIKRLRYHIVMDISMPPSFPMDEFRAYGIAASSFYGHLMDEKNLFDPKEKQRQLDWAWQAVRYRYRTCAECAAELRDLITDPNNAAWLAGGQDEELVYKLERCIHQFFTCGLSVFDSFVFGLYLLGHGIQPAEFPKAADPRKITRSVTAKAFGAAFPQAAITALLAGLPSDPRLTAVDNLRNILSHRVAGRRSVRSSSTMNPDGSFTNNFHEETWHIPGAPTALQFDGEMLQRVLDGITELLKLLIPAAQTFAESHTPAPVVP